ncbi:hypothetical protein RHGRI_032895 [Rhododendron griersonianum]|uniref:Uncharacterized protein n=1 Tax=Rhododendron griersonianum TaxID=479676 RepID=A0AAV6IDK4_9ERIC|nr:hypothetical protein RHGRI_032895 [Rhododendron griersonianum]
MAVRAEGGKDGGVAEGGGLDDGEELVVGEGGEEAAGVVGGELGGGGEEVGLLAVAVVVVPGGLRKEGLEFVRMRKRYEKLQWTNETGCQSVQSLEVSVNAVKDYHQFSDVKAGAGITEVHFLPFNPVDKRTAITYIDSNGNWHRASKGAPEQIIELCQVQTDIKRKAHDIIDKFADRGLRSLAVAQQTVPEKTKESARGPWVFVGLLPLFDPPRHDSAETIRQALKLGVNVKMITGDQLAIAKETGRRLGMGTNMYPSSTLLGQTRDETTANLPVEELIEMADGFAGVFPEAGGVVINAGGNPPRGGSNTSDHGMTPDLNRHVEYDFMESVIFSENLLSSGRSSNQSPFFSPRTSICQIPTQSDLPSNISSNGGDLLVFGLEIPNPKPLTNDRFPSSDVSPIPATSISSDFQKLNRAAFPTGNYNSTPSCYEAKDVVTDAGGNPLDFSKGRYVDLDTGMFVTNPKLMPMLLKAVRESLDEKASSL